MGTMQRNKGAKGERELARVLWEHLGVELRRNLDQSRTGGHDLIAMGYSPAAVTMRRFALEVKRRYLIKPADIAAWWHQATEQADRAGLIPALAYRADHRPWRIVIPLASIREDLPGDQTATLTVEGFAALVREGVN